MIKKYLFVILLLTFRRAVLYNPHEFDDAGLSGILADYQSHTHEGRIFKFTYPSRVVPQAHTFLSPLIGFTAI